MSACKQVIFLIILGFAVTTTYAQNNINYRHYTWWSRVTVGKVFAKRWEVSLEYQHRRQSYEKESVNPWEALLLHSFRTRIRYTIHENVTLSFLPFTYFYASPLLGNDNDYKSKPSKELRFALQAEIRQKIGTVEILNRYGYESRWIKRPPDSTYQAIGRFRYRLLLEKPFISRLTQKEIWRPYTSGEIFLNSGKNVKLTQVFEHIRIAGGVKWFVYPYLRVDTGYQYARRIRRSGTEGDHEHTLVTSFIFIF